MSVTVLSLKFYQLVLREFLKVLVSLEKVSYVAAMINKVTRLLILCIFRSKVTKNTKVLQHYFATLQSALKFRHFAMCQSCLESISEPQSG